MSTPLTLEHLYDRYSSMVYTIALQVSSSEGEAESILLSVFQKLHTTNPSRYQTLSCSTLIRLTLEVIRERNPKNFDLKLDAFADTPVINYIFCSKDGLNGYCKQNNLPRSEGLLRLRAEFSMLRTALSGTRGMRDHQQYLPVDVQIKYYPLLPIQNLLKAQ